MVTHWSILYHFIGCLAPRYVILHPPSTIAIPSLSLGAKNFLPRKRTYPHLSKGFNWLQLKTSSPHHCVGFLFFALHPPLLPRLSHLTHHSTTHYTTCHGTTHHTTLSGRRSSHTTSSHSTHHTTCDSTTHHHTTCHSTTNTPPHHTALITPLVTAQLIITPLVRAQHTPPHHTALITAQLITPLVTAVAGAVRSLLEELLHAWSPLGRGWLSCGRCSTQSLLQKLLHAWSPWARGWPQHWLSCGRLLHKPAACVVAAGTQLGTVQRASLQELLREWQARGCSGCRVAGAVHRASWRRCRWPALGVAWQAQYAGRGWLPVERSSTLSLREERHAWSPLGRGWLAQYTLLRAWPPLARSWLSCGTQYTELP